MEGHCSTGQSPRWAVVPMEEEVWYTTLYFIRLYYIYYIIFCIHYIILCLLYILGYIQHNGCVSLQNVRHAVTSQKTHIFNLTCSVTNLI